MDGEQQTSGIYVPTAWERIQPVLIGLSIWAMNGGLVVAGLAAAYLLFGILGGGLAGFESQPRGR